MSSLFGLFGGCSAPPNDGGTNNAFVFVKPHANTPMAVKMVSELLMSRGVKILKTGTITAEEIDSKKLIDQHYYAIASKATILKPDKLNVPADKFEGQFGIGWQAALDAGKVFNAMDACEKLGLDAEQMDAEWGKCKKAKKLIKFGGGFYCGLIEIEGKDPIYVFNGFFMQVPRPPHDPARLLFSSTRRIEFATPADAHRVHEARAIHHVLRGRMAGGHHGVGGLPGQAARPN